MIIAQKNIFFFWSLISRVEMEQSVLLLLSVYNSRNNPTVVTRKKPPEYKPEQIPTFRKDTLKNEINQQLSTSAFTLFNKDLDPPCIKLSNSNTLIRNGIETDVLLEDFAQRLKTESVPITDIYFTFLDAASITPDLLLNRHAKGKGIGA